MPYPRSQLNDGETVALDLHPHWWFFAKGVAALVVALIVGIVVRAFLDGDVEKYLTYAAIAAIVGCAIWVVRKYALWSTTNFVVTNHRVIYRSGVISKRGIEIPLRRVNNVLFDQSVFERILKAGDLMIESGGETGQQRFTDVRNPNRVKNLIYAQMAEDARAAPTAAGGTDVATQLEKLEGMLERGTLTQAEFDEQKRRLLDS